MIYIVWYEPQQREPSRDTEAGVLFLVYTIIKVA